MNTINSTLEPNQETELRQKINVILGHILVSKIFLYGFFEEYYVNFIRDGHFSEEDFLKSIRYTDEIFAGNNFTDRYTNFEQKADEIIASLEREENLLGSLLESITFNLPYIIGKTDSYGNTENFIADMDFYDNKNGIIIVQNGIREYISSEMNKLKQLIGSPEVAKIRSNLIEGLRTLEILS